jgi:DNA-binding CsgD family transcriptional regulator
MMVGNMDEVLANIGAQETVAGAVEINAAEMRRLGARAATFHISAPHQSQVAIGVYIGMFGYDEDWMRAYRDRDVRMHDPIPDYVMQTGRPMTYEEALTEITLTPAQAAFVERARAAGAFDSVAVPVYGPFDFDTYATFSLGRPFRAEDELILQRAIAMTEASNRRIAQLSAGETAPDIALSERESEVLNWIGQSKSNADIATILDLSLGTVDTYVRRIYAKLDTNDRIAAVLKGVRLGMIRF